MTRGLVRLLLILALAVAVPMKGIASVTMPGCHSHAAVHGGAASVQAATVHAHSEPAHHSDSGATADAVSDPHADPLAGAGSHADAKSKCGTCAPCCAGAALIGNFPASVSEPRADADFPASSSLHPSGRNTRLDRPPRHLVA